MSTCSCAGTKIGQDAATDRGSNAAATNYWTEVRDVSHIVLCPPLLSCFSVKCRCGSLHLSDLIVITQTHTYILHVISEAVSHMLVGVVASFVQFRCESDMCGEITAQYEPYDRRCGCQGARCGELLL